MNTGSFDDFERVDAILRQALELAPEDREQFVARACGSDKALRARIRAMLADSEDQTGGAIASGGALRSPVWDGFSRAAEDGDIAAGTRFGPWKVQEEIGRGGMAVVYRGERADGAFEQQVAIKLLRAPRSSTLERRFLHERRILARVEHPHIARLLDAGTTDSGCSWLAMEFVPGEPIDRYCNDRQLSIGDRLRLFLKVCAAVQFAHRNLIVHRDLKPSNILVTTDGLPKLLDFGIAKLLEPDLETGDLTQTALIDRVLTPQYASPEQVLGEPVSTVTDVYALGLLLYELLTGQRTRRFDISSPREIERVICDTDPVAPSLAAAPPRLARRLKGDLDNIVLKALRREPERRYASAEQLASDIRNHLEGRPVLARPNSAVYRMRKFVFRHAAGVASSIGAAILMAGLIAFYTDRLAQERDAAEAAAEAARIEATTATRVTDFLAAIFQAGDPFQRPEAEVPSATDLLQRAAERIESELVGEPVLQARLSMIIGHSYSNLGHYDEARKHLTTALDLRHQALGDAHPETAASLRALAHTAYRRGEYSTAETLYQKALRIQEQVLDPEHMDVADTLNGLSNLLKRTGRLPEARAGFERSLEIARANHGPDHLSVGRILNNLGLLLGEQEDYLQARDALERAISIYQAELGTNHLLLAEALGNLAHIQGRLGEYEKRIDNCRRYLEIAERQLGQTHPTVAIAQICLGNAFRSAGREEEANFRYGKALRIYEETVGPDHQHTAYPLANLGNVYRDTGNFEQAVVFYRRALDIWEQNQSTHLAVSMLESLGHVRILMGEPGIAEPKLRQALSMRQDLHPQGHWRIAETQSLLGESLVGMHKHEDAEPLLLQGYARLETHLGQDDTRTRAAARRLVNLYEASGRPEQAVPFRHDADPD